MPFSANAKNDFYNEKLVDAYTFIEYQISSILLKGSFNVEILPTEKDAIQTLKASLQDVPLIQIVQVRERPACGDYQPDYVVELRLQAALYLLANRPGG